MAEPSFGGINIFGPCATSYRAEPPNARQVNGYPGVRGVESIDLGWRTSTTDFAGLWVAASEGELSAFLMTMRDLKRAGAMAPLIDTKGIQSPDALLESWQVTGETVPNADGSCSVPYQMRFLHLGIVPGSGGSGGSGGGTGTGGGTTSPGGGTTSPGNTDGGTTSDPSVPAGE